MNVRIPNRVASSRQPAIRRPNERKAPVTSSDVLAYPASVPLWPEGGRALGLSRGVTYELANQGTLPVPVLRLGRRLLVRRVDLLDFLGIKESV